MRTPGLLRTPTYEAPAIALLDSGTLPNAFPVRAGGLVFPDRRGGGLVPLVVKVSTSSLHFDIDPIQHTYSGQVAVVARLKDQAGQVVQKLSQQYVLSGDEKDVEAAKKGEILFYREPRLAPGLYELEAIVYDIVAGKASARVSTLTVPDAERSGLQMSSLVIVARTETVADADSSIDAPLYFGNVLMYPNMGDPVSQSGDGEVAFYFSLYPGDRDTGDRSEGRVAAQRSADRCGAASDGNARAVGPHRSRPARRAPSPDVADAGHLRAARAGHRRPHQAGTVDVFHRRRLTFVNHRDTETRRRTKTFSVLEQSADHDGTKPRWHGGICLSGLPKRSLCVFVSSCLCD